MGMEFEVINTGKFRICHVYLFLYKLAYIVFGDGASDSP